MASYARRSKRILTAFELALSKAKSGPGHKPLLNVMEQAPDAFREALSPLPRLSGLLRTVDAMKENARRVSESAKAWEDGLLFAAPGRRSSGRASSDRQR